MSRRAGVRRRKRRNALYVDRAVHDGFLDKLAAKVDTLKSGNPTDPSVIIGPLINRRALEQVVERAKDAVDRGARLVTGGTSEGLVNQPTILSHVPEGTLCATGHDETFGPHLIVEAFDDAEAALTKAQDTPYGLSASIMTRDHARGLEMANRFDAGIVHVNGATMGSEAVLPVGGVKDSGWGRSGYYAREDFTEMRLTTVTAGPGRHPF